MPQLWGEAMAKDRVKRNLTDVLCADFRGCSRKMGEDEIDIFQISSDCLEIPKTIIAEHLGRVFSSPGETGISYPHCLELRTRQYKIRIRI